MADKRPKGFKEEFAKFFENPTRDGLRDLLQNHGGEQPNCDFKAQWPEHSGLSKHILGMANSGGGALIFGVEEQEDHTFEPVGLPTLKDKADITNGLKNYLPNALLRIVETIDFPFDASEYPKLVGKKFQVLFIGYEPDHIPFLSLKAGPKIESNRVYIRREGVTEEANYDELQRVLNNRIETGYSTRKEMDLKEHLAQLRVLIEEVRYVPGGLIQALGALQSLVRMQNPRLNEDFEESVLRIIDLKKQRIYQELDIQ